MFSYHSLQFGKKKKFYGENFQYWENVCEIGRAGDSSPNWEPLDQIRKVGMFAIKKLSTKMSKN